MKLLHSIKEALWPHYTPPPKVCFPAFGEAQVADVVEFSFEAGYAGLKNSPFSDKAMCKPESFPGLQRVLSESKSSPMPKNGSLAADIFQAGLTVAGPALGLPGIASMHFARGESGLEISALDCNQTPVSLKAKVESLSSLELSLELEGGRKIEVKRTALYGESTDCIRGLEFSSHVGDVKQGVVDCLVTNFDEQGQAISAGYERKMPGGRLLEATLNDDEGIKIVLAQRGEGDMAEDRFKVTTEGVEKVM